uniref:Peptidyl-prolyl cis-trans isomerase n=1 Tax=Ascaris suum TaxID=6253 RepID=F1L3C1_ASCSU
MAVLVETTLGDIVIDLFVKERPRCSLNFLKLCKMKYYNLCQFHTIEQNYIAQTGDPTGTGTGGESIYASLYGDQARYFEPEMVPKMRHIRMGLVSMVNNGGGMLGSQFFITLGEGLDYLDDKHTIFGQVTEGIETLEKLNEQICDEHNRPYKDIRIAHTIILDDPFDDPSQLKYPPRSPSPTIDLISASKIALDEALNEDEGKTEEEVRKEMEAKDMAAQAQILEMVGDLRHADDRPPENVLFVCKLNPVTTDEDLEIIFSRFGAIKCCEVIRDRRTGASLQYAFIEFEDEKSCENAYFKMDNVLVDDRRIHVDFSQSVAKNYKWHRKEELKQTDGEEQQRKRKGSNEEKERKKTKVSDEQTHRKGRSKEVRSRERSRSRERRRSSRERRRSSRTPDQKRTSEEHRSSTHRHHRKSHRDRDDDRRKRSHR